MAISRQAPVTADSTDVGIAGCARPAPFLAADSLNGYVHVAYHLVGREGAGRILCYTSDPAPHWGCNMVFWERYAEFWLRALELVVPAGA